MLKKSRLIVIFISIIGTTFLYAQSADQIVRNSDAVRAPNQPYTFTLDIADYEDGKQKNKKSMEVFLKGDGNTLTNHKTLVKFILPKADEGKLMLYNSNVLWMYFPNTRKPMRVSPQQRLLGQTSNGDVVNVSFSNDYSSKIIGQENVSGKNCYVLDLTAKRDDVTYHRIKYWVEKGSYRPVKTEHFAVSGRLIKTAHYTGYSLQLGKERPTEITIVDSIKNNLTTKMNYRNYRYKTLEDKSFQKDYLQYIK